MRFGGIEAGGTKFVVAAGTGPDDLTEPVIVATTDPDRTLGEVIDVLGGLGPLHAVGIAAFGPLDLRPGSSTAGTIISTPKPGWSGADIVGRVAAGTGLPVAFDVDVNGAALGEGTWGAAAGLHSFVYVTVGTGVGGGAMVAGRLLHGLNHPEMGHLRIPRHPEDPFPGVCPFHGDCLEGLVSGPAIAQRWSRPADALGDREDEAVALVGWYLGTGLADIALTLSPQRIVVGGGVAKLPGLLAATRERFLGVLSGYLGFAELLDAGTFIVPPALGDRAGVLGAVALARNARTGSAPRGGQ